MSPADRRRGVEGPADRRHGVEGPADRRRGTDRRLRVALVHSFYGSGVPSGENEAVSEQAAALRRAGHQVALVAARTDDLRHSPLHPLQAGLTVATGLGRSPLPRLRALAPDIVHVHNLFPNFGWAWLREWGGPLVATLHNFRPLCAAATLHRAGAHCTDCPDGDRWAAVRHGCYRGSRAATLPLAWAGRNGPAAHPVLRRADRLIVLSELSRDTYVKAAGVSERRMALLPHFVADVPGQGPEGPGGAEGVDLPGSFRREGTGSTGGNGGRPSRSGRPENARQGSGPWVFAGRLSTEKGILELLRRWPPRERLDVVGSGELAAACRAAAPPSVRFLGTLDRSALRRTMPYWRGLVFPSRCLEGAVPLVYAEALAAGLPVLAFEGSSVPQAVRAQGTGQVVGWDDPLADALRAAALRFPALRDHCRRVFADKYAEQAWIPRIQRIYEEAQCIRPPVHNRPRHRPTGHTTLQATPTPTPDTAPHATPRTTSPMTSSATAQSPQGWPQPRPQESTPYGPQHRPRRSTQR